MNLPVSPLRAAARLCAVVTFAACLAAHAPAARAVEIQVEGPQDSLLGPPEDFNINHCTLRKAVNNANDNLATYPQCQAGETGDLDVTDDLIITGHPDGTTIDANDLDRVFHVHPGVTLTLRNIHITNGRYPSGGGILVGDGPVIGPKQ